MDPVAVCEIAVLVEQPHGEADPIYMKDIVLPVPFDNAEVAELPVGVAVGLDADVLDFLVFVAWSM